jgi:hypothetical protein
MKKALITIAILAVLAGAFWAWHDWTYVTRPDVFTHADAHYGCYWGDANQKKPGTPADWILVLAGTKNAQWCTPSMPGGIFNEVQPAPAH